MQGVASNFRQIFAKLAPGGKGELVMLKVSGLRGRNAEVDEPAENGGEPASVLEKYSGVAVKVDTAVDMSMAVQCMSADGLYGHVCLCCMRQTDSHSKAARG